MGDTGLDSTVPPMSLKRPLNVQQEDGGGDNKREKLASNQKPVVLVEDDPAARNIEQTADGNFKLALQVHKTFFSGLIGPDGGTKRYIETKTKTELCIPKQKGKSNEVLIKGKQRDQVCAALREVRNRIATVRKKLRPTHFLAVPLNMGQVLERFLDLKKSILEARLPGIDKELFIQERTLHLTLDIYTLIDNNELQRAIKELKTCHSFLTDLKTPFDIKVRGLETMNDKPSFTRVLYAKIESAELQKFADRCLAHFQTTGLCANDNNDIESVKLHMTVMNNRYRRELMRKKCPNSFDATEILKRFGDFDFGSAQCQAVHLCAMQREKDFYKIAGSLKFEDEESKTLEELKASEEAKNSEELKASEEAKNSEETKASEKAKTSKESKTSEETKTAEESKNSAELSAA